MTVRIDNQQKAIFDELCAEFGMSANTAINIFVRAVIRSKSIPFPIVADGEDVVRGNALRAFERMREEGLARPEITLDEINAEIEAVRMKNESSR